MRGLAVAALPLFVPADVLHLLTGVAGFRRREPAVGDHQCRSAPACFVGQVAARGTQSSIGESTPSGAGSGSLLLQHRCCSESLDHDAAVGFSQSCCQNMQMVSTDIVDPAMQPGQLVVRSRYWRSLSRNGSGHG